jgi:D-3-phosphoglycerate dehydrogenase / 2-oxoglutarate reductase
MSAEKRKVIVLTASWHWEKVKLLEEMGVEVKKVPDGREDLFLGECRDALAVVPGLSAVTRGMMEQAPQLLIIAAHGVGYNNVDLAAADEMGILVTNVPGANSDAVAEFTFGFMLTLVRYFPQAWEEMKKGGWRRPGVWGTELRGKTLGIIGLGQIGSRVSKLGNAFGMKVLAFDPYIGDRSFREAGAEAGEKDEVISRADLLTLHTPLTEETRRMIGERELSLMKETAFLINTSRGGVVDERALLMALNRSRISGAALDVFESEPPADRSLVEHPRVVVAPHIAGLTNEARYRLGQGAAERILSVFRGETPTNVVNNPTNPRYLRLK